MAAFIAVPVEVYNMNLSVHALAVYVVLRKHYNPSKPDEPVIPSNETIASKLNISRSSVKLAIRELVAKKIIRRESRYKNSCNTYILK